MNPIGRVPPWTSELAYAIGLLTTDGNLSKDGRHIEFTSKDKNLVETFKKCLSLKNKIGKKTRGYSKIKQYYRVQFGNVILYKWLLKIGLMPNKSRRLGTLKIPNAYFADFLRGDMDGDGCIRKFQDPVYKNSQRLYVVFHAASHKHIQWLRGKIHELLSIRGFIEQTTRQFRLTFAKKESLKLLPYLYHRENLPSLIRKHKLAES